MKEFFRTATLQLPYIGGNQTIAPVTSWFSPVVNVNLGYSAAPQIETEVLDEVGSYGKQLGRIGDVIELLLDKLEPKLELEPKEADTVLALRGMLADIRKIKRRNGRA
jgi:hypothetical protein